MSPLDPLKRVLGQPAFQKPKPGASVNVYNSYDVQDSLPPHSPASTSDDPGESDPPLYSALYEKVLLMRREQMYGRNEGLDYPDEELISSSSSKYDSYLRSLDPDWSHQASHHYEYDGDAILQSYSELSGPYLPAGYGHSHIYEGHPAHQFLTFNSIFESEKDINPNTVNEPDAVKFMLDPSSDQSLHIHEPVPDSRRSAYSELSANVEYMASLAQTRQALSLKSFDTTQRRLISQFSNSDGQACYWYPDTAEVKPQEPLSWNPPGMLPHQVKGSSPPEDWSDEDVDLAPSLGPKSATTKSHSIRSLPQKKRPSLACFFCRERKIACGRPPEGSLDPTCHQCARRSLLCDYPAESHRGQHKRSRKRDCDHNFH